MRLFTQLIAVCAVATMFAADATAQRRGGWYGGRYYGGGGYYYPGGNYYGGNYGYGYQPYYRSGYYSNYPSYGYSNPSYGYTNPSYSYSNPGYSNYNYPNQSYYYPNNANYYSGPSTSMYQGQTSNAQVASVRVIVPDPSARVTVQGQEMQATGAQRDFASPALEPGRTYTYTIGATWTANGQTVSRQKQVDVQSGRSVLVDFNIE